MLNCPFNTDLRGHGGGINMRLRLDYLFQCFESLQESHNYSIMCLFFSVTFRTNFCLQHPQFSSGSLSVSAVDSRAAVQILQSERYNICLIRLSSECLFSKHSHSLTDRPLLSVFICYIDHYMLVIHKQ